MKLTPNQIHELATRPIRLWRAPVSALGCSIIHPLKRWAGVQVGLQYYSGPAGGGKIAGPTSVYYSIDDDITDYRRKQ